MSLRINIKADRGLSHAELAKRSAPAQRSEVDPHRAGWLSRVRSFLGAVTGPKAPESVSAERLEVCRGCAYKRDDKGKEYCTACGCGKWPLAELSTKLTYANLECPHLKWGKWSEKS